MKKIMILVMVFTLFNSSTVLSKPKKPSKIEMIPWEDVNHLLPKYSKFIVKDIDTGLKFKVQRRAGSRHADVQPLTSKDTGIMKKIYNGKWSWKRRAIIVIHKDKRIAASMHGMPHGAGALKNNFPGHFCIHFYGSTTHRTNHMDLSHKLMILKASGNLPGYFASADPYEVVTAFITGFKQQDPKIVRLLSSPNQNWGKILYKIENAAITQMSELPAEDLKDELYLEVPIKLQWIIKNQGFRNEYLTVYLTRYSPFDAWKIDSNSFLDSNDFLMKK